MTEPIFALYLTCFLIFNLLPLFFFRADGKFHLMWWVTGLPFGLFPIVMALGVAGVLTSPTPHRWSTALEVGSVFPAVASLALLFMTLGTHRTRLALWHQDDDAPESIVTYGAYGRIRHPFYTSFLLAFTGGAIAFPNVATLLLLLYAAVLLNATAAREERRLSASRYGSEYRDYITRTNRFVPLPGGQRLKTEAEG